MKTNELMICDWVMYNPNVFIEDEYEPTKQCYPTKILNGENIDLAIKDCYTPIPLTAEILEKNGFVKGEFVKVGYKDIKVENHTITFNYPKYDIEVWEGELFLMRLPLNSVHELQHALKLCKIDKEIEL